MVVKNSYESKNLKNKQKQLFVICFITFLFCLAIATNISPLLRGPYDSLLKSQWPYYFVNTFSKIWVFIPIYLFYLFLVRFIYKKTSVDQKTEGLMLFILVTLTFLFQIGLVYFSRFGIGVLFRRLVDPGINGYFTTAVNIHDINFFIDNFPLIINSRTLAQHASGHTPGAIIMLKTIIEIISLLPSTLYNSIIQNVHVGDANNLWITLSSSNKFAALIIPFILHLFASATIVPFYFLANSFYQDRKHALLITIIYSIIPSLSFFAMVFDPIYSLFPIVLSLLMYIGVKRNEPMYFFWSGVITVLGLFFSAFLLTFIFGLIVFCALSIKRSEIKIRINNILFFITGVFTTLIGFTLIGFDFPSSLIAVIHNQASREYLPWLLFNPYDFFVFMGIPVSITFISLSIHELKNKTNISSLTKRLTYTFWITFIILILSGASRGEVGRIWLGFMFLPVILVGNYTMNDLKFTNRDLVILFTFLFIQVIIMEEFWVPIW
ncbi:MAG TPA: hypothetical protein VHE53_01130 [Patescibacteria group bacterium]|nr:hypothetical protein [Patescibacteria group bacterium]